LESAGIAPNGEHAMEPISEALIVVWQEMRAAGKLRMPAPAQRCA